MKKQSFFFRRNGKRNLLIVSYGIQNKGTDNAYFSITGSTYRPVNSKSGVSRYGEEYKEVDGKYYADTSGGCIHDEIMSVTKRFNDLIPMHLANVHGYPMHAFANGYYHLRNGFTDMSTSDDAFADRFCEYYRIPNHLFSLLVDTSCKEAYAAVLFEHGVPLLWSEQAEKIIEQYEL
jgi:hypothetical protein